MATVVVVKKTRLMPSAEMGLMLALKSCHDVREAASKSNGGKKTRKIISGSKLKSGRNGMKPMISPTSTSSTGYGIFNLSTIADKLSNTAMMKITISKFSITQILETSVPVSGVVRKHPYCRRLRYFNEKK